MSKFWSNINSRDMLPDDYEGIISRENPFLINNPTKITNDLYIDTIINKNIENDTVYFILGNSARNGGLSYLLNPKFLSDNLTSHLIDHHTGEILGFIMYINHQFKFNGLKYPTGLSTYLTVSAKYRNMNLASLLIGSIISHKVEENVYVGYHYVDVPRTPNNVKCQCYFRVIDDKLATEFGYRYSPDQVEIRASSDYQVRVANFEDLDIADKTGRSMTISFTEKDYTNFLKYGQGFSVIHKSKVVGVMLFQPILLHIGKVNRICPIGRVVWMETLSRHTHHAIAAMINHLIVNKKFVVISGIGCGSLSDKSIRKNLGMVDTSEMYLDFYNLKFKKYNSENVNLLYI